MRVLLHRFDSEAYTPRLNVLVRGFHRACPELIVRHFDTLIQDAETASDDHSAADTAIDGAICRRRPRPSFAVRAVHRRHEITPGRPSMRRDHRARSSSILGALRGRIRESRRRARKRFVLSCPALEPRELLSTFTVTNTSDSDQDTGSLRWAIEQANADTGSAPVLIDFGIPGTGPFTISPTTPLPTITHSVVIDGYTQPGASANTQAQGDNATILIDLDGGSIPSSDGLTVAANGSTVRGIAVGDFSNGIHVQASDVQIAGDFIGTDPTGTTARVEHQHRPVHRRRLG